MGLDSYASACDVVDDELVNAEELMYWRKHNALHGWMQKLHEKKYGLDDDYNCVDTFLDKEDLLELWDICTKQAVLNKGFEETQGFFFGADSRKEYFEYYFEQDSTFIKAALKALEDGRKVYYTSWW